MFRDGSNFDTGGGAGALGGWAGGQETDSKICIPKKVF